MGALQWNAFLLIGFLLAALLPCRPGSRRSRSPARQESTRLQLKSPIPSLSGRRPTFRKELPEGSGMLFDFHREQEVGFWMQNTYVPLDMIFIRGDGRILRIAEDTEPLSTWIIPSNGPVRAVLEVIAGTAEKLGIAPGDRVASPIFNAN